MDRNVEWQNSSQSIGLYNNKRVNYMFWCMNARGDYSPGMCVCMHHADPSGLYQASRTAMIAAFMHHGDKWHAALKHNGLDLYGIDSMLMVRVLPLYT